jgi:hypothetical protein
MHLRGFMHLAHCASSRPTMKTSARNAPARQRGEIMAAKLTLALILLLVPLGLSGCVHNEMFSFLDYCYLADWTNQQSPLSCCPNGDCQHP